MRLREGKCKIFLNFFSLKEFPLFQSHKSPPFHEHKKSAPFSPKKILIEQKQKNMRKFFGTFFL